MLKEEWISRDLPIKVRKSEYDFDNRMEDYEGIGFPCK